MLALDGATPSAYTAGLGTLPSFPQHDSNLKTRPLRPLYGNRLRLQMLCLVQQRIALTLPRVLLSMVHDYLDGVGRRGMADDSVVLKFTKNQTDNSLRGTFLCVHPVRPYYVLGTPTKNFVGNYSPPHHNSLVACVEGSKAQALWFDAPNDRLIIVYRPFYGVKVLVKVLSTRTWTTIGEFELYRHARYHRYITRLSPQNTCGHGGTIATLQYVHEPCGHYRLLVGYFSLRPKATLLGFEEDFAPALSFQDVDGATLSFSPDGSRLMLWNPSGWLCVWRTGDWRVVYQTHTDPDNPKKKRQRKGPNQMVAAAFHPTTSDVFRLEWVEAHHEWVLYRRDTAVLRRRTALIEPASLMVAHGVVAIALCGTGVLSVIEVFDSQTYAPLHEFTSQTADAFIAMHVNCDEETLLCYHQRRLSWTIKTFLRGGQANRLVLRKLV